MRLAVIAGDGIGPEVVAEGLKVLPLCGFASSWMRRHKQHRDLLA